MRILIATDGSEFSSKALEKYYSLLGDLKNAEIKVVSVYQDVSAIATEPFAVNPEYCQDIIDASHRMAESFTTDAVAFLVGKFNGNRPRISSEVLSGIPAQRIVEKAKEWQADLIVVGSHGRGFFGRMLGSVSDGVVHHAPCSVLVVRSGGE